MKEAGRPDPVYQLKSFMLYAELRNKEYGSGKSAETVLSSQATPQVTPQATPQDHDIEKNMEALSEFCRTPRTRTEMMQFLKLSDRKYFREGYLQPMLTAGKIHMTIPDKPNSPKQKYYS